MNRIISCSLAVVLIVAGVAPAQEGGPGLYLYRIPASMAGAGNNLGDDLLQAELAVPDPGYAASHLAAQTSLTVVGQSEDRVLILSGVADTISSEPAAGHLADSFVIDFLEPSVAGLIDRTLDGFGPHPTIDELKAIVAESIPNKTYSRGFDLASQVAASGEGDCTEHAVLLAALARALEVPARVTFGILLVEAGGELNAYGHAWTELHDGTRWQIADATHPENSFDDARLRYLPLESLDDEGPGYGLNLMRLVAIQPSAVFVLSSPPADPAAE